MLEKPIESKEIGCSLASLQDIACMKLSAIAHRGAKKDFVDLYFLVQDIALDSMLDAYRKKFGVRDVAHVITALAYFDDADRQRMPVMIRRVGWRKVKAAIRAQVRRIG